MKWITRERPKIDRIACPWLITRFIDSEAKFFSFRPRMWRVLHGSGVVRSMSRESSYLMTALSAASMLSSLQLEDPSLATLATIVRGDRHRSARYGSAMHAGLLAISLGLSRLFQDDHEQLRHGFVIYDALYAWVREARLERHSWNPQKAALVRGSTDSEL